MNWINDTQNAISYIENNLLENINVNNVSKHINSSTDYFHRTFNIVTGLSISEYGTFHKRIYEEQAIDACGGRIEKYAKAYDN